MKPGTQVIYIPAHTLGKTDHPGCRHGFIASEAQLGQSVFVCFWQADAVGVTLRQAGAQLTDSTRLVAFESCEQGIVDGLVEPVGNKDQHQ